jgi:hypothetical protein
MRINGKRAITGGLILAAVGAAALPATAAHAGTRAGEHGARPLSTDNCSNGAACMYTSPPTDATYPEHYWTLYGCYNLSGEYNTRWVFNNQYNGATVTLWTGANCSGTPTTINAGQTWSGNITPINSVSLNQ